MNYFFCHILSPSSQKFRKVPGRAFPARPAPRHFLNTLSRRAC
ncbi:hypothetical protein HMPREF1986_01627 [Oribacterium sp. oral taxon 078 str. F0263]|nr:hypothetical protein HMPREF1986_01627 [Oribacterium sp. oral taxon 078 str. F0263]